MGNNWDFVVRHFQNLPLLFIDLFIYFLSMDTWHHTNAPKFQHGLVVLDLSIYFGY